MSAILGTSARRILMLRLTGLELCRVWGSRLLVVGVGMGVRVYRLMVSVGEEYSSEIDVMRSEELFRAKQMGCG